MRESFSRHTAVVNAVTDLRPIFVKPRNRVPMGVLGDSGKEWSPSYPQIEVAENDD